MKEKRVNEQSVVKGQVYMAIEDMRRWGVTRTITIERTVRAKRGHDERRKVYAVGVSLIVAHPTRPELNGKKRRVFIEAANLISSEYTLIESPGKLGAAEPTTENTTAKVPCDSFGDALPVPAEVG